eukprot:1158644-Pelagomonas_calceolata.AAC.1
MNTYTCYLSVNMQPLIVGEPSYICIVTHPALYTQATSATGITGWQCCCCCCCCCWRHCSALLLLLASLSGITAAAWQHCTLSASLVCITVWHYCHCMAILHNFWLASLLLGITFAGKVAAWACCATIVHIRSP